MADGKLVFLRPADGTGRLVFNDDAVSAAPPAEISIDAGFADDMASGTVQLLWDANVSRGERAEVRTRWQSGEPAGGRAATAWQVSQSISVRTAVREQIGQPTAGLADVRWSDGERMGSRTAAVWQTGADQRHALQASWQEAERLRAGMAAAWQDGTAQRLVLDARWDEAVRMRTTAAARWQDAGAMGSRAQHSNRAGLPLRRTLATAWQDARRPPAGLSLVVAPQPPVVEPCYDPETLGRLVFSEPWVAGDGRLVFVCIRDANPGPVAPLYILPARFYMAVHSLTCHKLPSMEPVPIYGVTLSADEGSFGWSFRANAPLSVFDQLAATGTTPTRVLITLDGIPFEFVLDEPESTRGFGRQGATISGRSATALLASPYQRETARINFAPSTAQQLALQALDLTGFALDWGLTDWLVPAGAWSHIGTPLSAVQAIVAAAGGHLQSARNAATLQARHPYPDLTGGIPGAPWMWADPAVVPDIELAPDALVTVNTSRVFGADVNAVYVSGTTAGFRALYKRQGTAGTKLASPITEPLGTAAEVLRQRGRAVVGAAGLKQFVTLELPVLTGASQPGVIDPGALLQINSAVPWRGRVRGVSVTAPFGGKVRQQLRVEQHLEVTP